MNEKQPPVETPPTPTDGSPTNDMPTIDSEALFEDNDILLIEHNGEVYTLRKTRKGKLILTK